jgi:hypothetical protein
MANKISRDLKLEAVIGFSGKKVDKSGGVFVKLKDITHSNASTP